MIIWGNKGYSDFLGYIREKCPECGTDGIFEVHQARKKFTLYFIPTFTYSREQFMVCRACETPFKVPKRMKAEVAASLVTREELVVATRQASDQPEAYRAVPDSEYVSDISSRGDFTPISGLAVRYCIHCGAVLVSQSRYCHSCGGEVPNFLVQNGNETSERGG